MITVTIKKEQDHFTNIQISGHAMYADYGKDIVCSAVSSIAITTVNAILALSLNSISYQVNDQGLLIEITKQDETTEILLGNMIAMLKELEQKYPKNIKVR